RGSGLAARRRLHGSGEEAIAESPGLACRRIELGAEGLLERGEEGARDNVVVAIFDPILRVPAAERLDGGQDRGKAVETVDGERYRAHQLAALLGHVALEKQPETGIEVEERVVEELGRHVGMRCDLREASLHESDLVWRHRGSQEMDAIGGRKSTRIASLD